MKLISAHFTAKSNQTFHSFLWEWKEWLFDGLARRMGPAAELSFFLSICWRNETNWERIEGSEGRRSPEWNEGGPLCWWMIDAFLWLVSLLWVMGAAAPMLRNKRSEPNQERKAGNQWINKEKESELISFNLSGSQHEMKWSVDGADWMEINERGSKR